MNGLQYLRNILGMTAKEFGELIDVKQPTIAKWENGIEPISKKKAALLYVMFKCNKEILEAELDDETELQIRRCACAYKINIEQGAGSYGVPNGLFQDQEDNSLEQIEHKVNIYKEHFYTNPSILRKTEKIIRLASEKNAEEALNVALAAVEIYLTGKYKYLAVGDTNYRRGLIKKDDPLVNIIVQALKLGLQKEKEKDD